ncbi:MAG: hypothetical protein NTU45_15645 [Planctomycetota bacterium]|jgi:putative transposase|nr:hypothetical protein [Planctomycetota bacterium]
MQQHLGMKQPPNFKRMQRIDTPNAARFLTFSCFRQQRIFTLHCHFVQFTESLLAYSRSGYIDLHGWVLMPNHCHLLLTPNSSELATSLELFKRSVAARLRRVDPRLESIWRPGGGYDRTIYSCGEFREKLRYIHLNAVRDGLARTNGDWPWHSWQECRGEVRPSMPRITAMSAERLARAREAWRAHRRQGLD